MPVAADHVPRNLRLRRVEVSRRIDGCDLRSRGILCVMGYTAVPKSDFVKRTMFNLEFIEKHKDREDGPYEFTQLINSFLMAFIHPKAHWIEQFPPMPYPATGWPAVNSVPIPGQEHREPTNARQLVERIRDALAHGNFEILTSGQGANTDIDAVALWNTPRESSSTKTWHTAAISVEDLRRILHAFVPVMLGIAAQNGE